ncbi:MAG TPA: DNA-binding protein HU [Bacteroidetes bacterium]|mgnify:FL=1|nr:DNA-binding protein HU [Bacteroidota bacterium]
MNKAQLVEKIAATAKLNKTQANNALDAFIDTTMGSLKKGGKVTLVGFGTFTVNKRQARMGRNPQTGKAIKIAAKKVVKFKAGKDFATKVK